MIHDIKIMHNKKMMMKTIISPFFIFIGFQLFFIALFFNDIVAIKNIEFAYFSALFIIVGAFLSYKKTIKKGVENFNMSEDLDNDLDTIDALEDPFDLYSKDIKEKDIPEVLKEEKAKNKKETLKNMQYSLPTFVSMYRLIPYSLLILGFLYLVNKDEFRAIIFIIGLTTGIVQSFFLIKILKN